MSKKHLIILGTLISGITMSYASGSGWRFVRGLDNLTLGQSINATVKASQKAAQQSSRSTFNNQAFVKQLQQSNRSRFNRKEFLNRLRRNRYPLAKYTEQPTGLQAVKSGEGIKKTINIVPSLKNITKKSKIKISPMVEAFIKDTQKRLPQPKNRYPLTQYNKLQTGLKTVESGVIKSGNRGFVDGPVPTIKILQKSGLPAVIPQVEPKVIQIPHWSSSIRFASFLKNLAKKIVQQADLEQAATVAAVLTTMVGFLLVDQHFDKQEMIRAQQAHAEQLLLLKSTLGEFYPEDYAIDYEQVVDSLADITVSADKTIPTEGDDKATKIDFIVEHVTNIIFKIAGVINKISLPKDLAKRVKVTATLLFDDIYVKGEMTLAFFKKIISQTALITMDGIEELKEQSIMTTEAVLLFTNELLSSIKGEASEYYPKEIVDSLTVIAGSVLNQVVDLPDKMKEMSSQMMLNAMMNSLQIIVENLSPQDAAYLVSAMLNDQQQELFVDAYGALATDDQRSQLVTLLKEHNEAVKMKNVLYEMDEETYSIQDVTKSLEKVLMVKTFTQYQKDSVIQRMQEAFKMKSDVLHVIDNVMQKVGYVMQENKEPFIEEESTDGADFIDEMIDTQMDGPVVGTEEVMPQEEASVPSAGEQLATMPEEESTNGIKGVASDFSSSLWGS